MKERAWSVRWYTIWKIIQFIFSGHWLGRALPSKRRSKQTARKPALIHDFHLECPRGQQRTDGGWSNPSTPACRSPRWNLAVQGGLDGIEMFGALGQYLATLAIGGDDFGSNRVRSGLGDGKVPEYFLNPKLPVVLLS
ncbi:MAG: hypothetical protein Q8L62_13055 [Candidatus Nitrotoga sp.]|nr:hypothetical protein [Candidatus Nitrotoga sp.]